MEPSEGVPGLVASIVGFDYHPVTVASLGRIVSGDWLVASSRVKIRCAAGNSCMVRQLD